jgi:hypothetical protein
MLRPVYGERLRGVYLFGSRARGDHTPESDADVAVVLADGDWDYWNEKMRLADLEYDTIIATGAEPQGWPVRESEWLNPVRHRNPELVRAMRRDAKDLLARAWATWKQWRGRRPKRLAFCFGLPGSGALAAGRTMQCSMQREQCFWPKAIRERKPRRTGRC